MRSIKVSKESLLAILISNRNKHREVVEEAWEGYRKEAVRVLEEQLDRAHKGLKKNLYVQLNCPEDHTDDYDRVIAMLQMDISDTVELPEQDFTQYVQDDWGWKRQWTMTNSMYAASLSPLPDEDDEY